MNELPAGVVARFLKEELEKLPAIDVELQSNKLNTSTGAQPSIEYDGETLSIVFPEKTRELPKFISIGKLLGELIDNCPYQVVKASSDGGEVLVEAERGDEKIKLSVAIVREFSNDVWPEIEITGTPTEIITALLTVKGYLSKYFVYSEGKMFDTAFKAFEGMRRLLNIPEFKEVTLRFERSHDKDIELEVRIDNKKFHLTFNDGVWHSKDVENLTPEETAVLGLCSGCNYWSDVNNDAVKEELEKFKKLVKKLKNVPEDVEITVYRPGSVSVSKELDEGHYYFISDTMAGITVKNAGSIKPFLEEVKRAYGIVEELTGSVCRGVKETVELLSKHADELEKGKLWFADTDWEFLRFSDTRIYSFERGKTVSLPLGEDKFPENFEKLLNALKGEKFSILYSPGSSEDELSVFYGDVKVSVAIDGNKLTLKPSWVDGKNPKGDFEKLVKKLKEAGFEVDTKDEHLVEPPTLDIEFESENFKPIRGIGPERFERLSGLEATFPVPGRDVKITVITGKKDSEKIRLKLPHPYVFLNKGEIVVDLRSWRLGFVVDNEEVDELPMPLLCCEVE